MKILSNKLIWIALVGVAGWYLGRSVGRRTGFEWGYYRAKGYKIDTPAWVDDWLSKNVVPQEIPPE